MSGDRTTPRFDVVATARRRWSREQKRAIVAEIDVGGATLSEVARRHGIHASLLFRWRKELGSVFAVPSVGAEATAAPATPLFLPVMLPAPAAHTPTHEGARVGAIEIVLDGGRTVRVGSDVDTVALVRIVDALESRAGGVREKRR